MAPDFMPTPPTGKSSLKLEIERFGTTCAILAICSVVMLQSQYGADIICMRKGLQQVWSMNIHPFLFQLLSSFHLPENGEGWITTYDSYITDTVKYATRSFHHNSVFNGSWIMDHPVLHTTGTFWPSFPPRQCEGGLHYFPHHAPILACATRPSRFQRPS